jgi:hypothetical protein
MTYCNNTSSEYALYKQLQLMERAARDGNQIEVERINRKGFSPLETEIFGWNIDNPLARAFDAARNSYVHSVCPDFPQDVRASEYHRGRGYREMLKQRLRIE